VSAPFATAFVLRQIQGQSRHAHMEMYTARWSIWTADGDTHTDAPGLQLLVHVRRARQASD
jgi:hypothetical protein